MTPKRENLRFLPSAAEAVEYGAFRYLIKPIPLHDLTATGVEFTTPPADFGVPTARSMVLVTPDGHRTMNTFLGAAQHLPSSALDEAQIVRGVHRVRLDPSADHLHRDAVLVGETLVTSGDPAAATRGLRGAGPGTVSPACS